MWRWMRGAAWLGVVALGGCAGGGFEEPLPPPPPLATRATPASRVVVDEERREVRVVAGPFHVPAMAPGGHHHGRGEHGGMKSPLIPLAWPVDAGLQGFRLAMYDADGRPLPRDLMHHMIAVNFDRRQLVYPVAERTFGFGTETEDVRLPDRLSVPLQQGDRLGMYLMWNNTTGHDLDGVMVQVALPYAEPGSRAEAVLPVYFDTNNHIGGATAFDLRPGLTARSFEFTPSVSGRLLAAGGHLHDYGVELRLEDVATGAVLFRLQPQRTPTGEVLAVERKIFRRFFHLVDASVRLEEGHPYRVVGVYDNPTGRVIPDGGMAHIVGLFAPDDPGRWPRLDRTAPEYAQDVGALPAPLVATASHR